MGNDKENIKKNHNCYQNMRVSSQNLWEPFSGELISEHSKNPALNVDFDVSRRQYLE